MIRISVTEPWTFDGPSGDLERSTEAKAGFADELEKTFQKAAAKFEEYPECLKILLVQFHGDDSFILDEDVVQIIESTQLHEMIDQVWLAQYDWSGEDEHTVVWNHVR